MVRNRSIHLRFDGFCFSVYPISSFRLRHSFDRNEQIRRSGEADQQSRTNTHILRSIRFERNDRRSGIVGRIEEWPNRSQECTVTEATLPAFDSLMINIQSLSRFLDAPLLAAL